MIKKLLEPPHTHKCVGPTHIKCVWSPHHYEYECVNRCVSMVIKWLLHNTRQVLCKSWLDPFLAWTREYICSLQLSTLAFILVHVPRGPRHNQRHETPTKNWNIDQGKTSSTGWNLQIRDMAWIQLQVSNIHFAETSSKHQSSHSIMRIQLCTLHENTTTSYNELNNFTKSLKLIQSSLETKQLIMDTMIHPCLWVYFLLSKLLHSHLVLCEAKSKIPIMRNPSIRKHLTSCRFGPALVDTKLVETGFSNTALPD